MIKASGRNAAPQYGGSGWNINMGKKALITILWLISAWTVTGLVVKGKGRFTAKPAKNVQQYRNVAQGVYASAYARAAPYGAFSFNVPVAVPAAKAGEMKRRKIKPVKRDTQNFNGFITDSYGKPVTQSDAYKTAFLQQFAQFQNPTQLQPLAAPSYQFSQGLQAPWPWNNAFAQNGQFAKPFVFPNDVKNFNSLSEQLQLIAPSNLEQDTSKNRLYYAGQGFNWIQNEPEYQWVDEEPYQNKYYSEEPHQYQPPNLMAKVQTPIRHTVRTNQHGKDVVVQIETKPPLPLVDLRLLEPLKFPNGIQLQ